MDGFALKAASGIARVSMAWTGRAALRARVFGYHMAEQEPAPCNQDDRGA